MILYLTDKDFIYNGKTSNAVLNPNYNEETHLIDDKYIYNPRRSSLINPDDPGENKAMKLIDGEWVKVVDRVGQYYYEQSGLKKEITEFDFDVPEGSIQSEPVSIYHETHNGNVWIENTEKKEFDEAEQTRISEHEAEKSSFVKKTLPTKEQWVKDRLNETSFDNPSKIAIGKIFRRLIAFTD